MRSVVIADAGPLIALSRIDALDLLRGLFGQVLVTEEVRDEALPAADYPGKALIAFTANPALAAGFMRRDQERAMIIDDRAGRAEAKSHHLVIIGTAAVIGLARLQGLIPAARPVLDRLQPAGYFIHPRIIEAVLQDVGE